MRRTNVQTDTQSQITETYKSFLEHLYDEYLKKHHLSAAQKQLLENRGFITSLPKKPKKEANPRQSESLKRDFTISHKNEVKALQYTDVKEINNEEPFTVPDLNDDEARTEVLTEEEYKDFCLRGTDKH